MVRKIPLILLALSGALFWQMAAKCLADDRSLLGQADGHRSEKEYLQAETLYKQIINESNDVDRVLAAQKRLTILYIESNDELRAKAGFQELVTKFAGHEGVPEVVFELGEEYREVKKYDSAREVYQYVVDHWPQAGLAIEAQEAAIQLSIRLKDEAAAERGYDDLITKFAGNEELAKALDHVADEYRDADNYKKARAIYRYILKTWPEADHAKESQRGVVISSIRLGDDVNAVTGLEKLIADFGHDEWITGAVRDVADEYCDVKKYDRALEIYEYAIGQWPKAEGAIESQKGIVLANVLLGDEAAAQRGVEELISKFGGDEEAEDVVFDIANECRDLEKNKLALAVYQKVVENWPGKDEAIDSRTNTAKLYISLGDDPNAEAATQKLLTDFGGHNFITRAIEDVAKAWGEAGRHEKAAELYGYIVERWPGSDDTLWAQMRLVTSHIRQWDLDGAEMELVRLLSDFAGHKNLSDAVQEVVDDYYKHGEYERGRELYNQFKDIESGDEDTLLELQVGVVISNVGLGEESAVDAGIEKLISDFNDNPKLAKGLVQIGEKYYELARWHRNREYEDDWRACLQRATSIWKRIVYDLPRGDYSQEACYFTGRCYHELGEYETAIEHYDKVVSEWPNDKRACEAQYQIVLSYHELRMKGAMPLKEAVRKKREAVKKLVTEYPGCELVGVAIGLVGGREHFNPREEGEGK
jgi:TolA-binding protein